MQIGKLLLLYIVPLISPTYLIADWLKNKTEAKYNAQMRRNVIITLNTYYFFLSWLIVLLLLFWRWWLELFPLTARFGFLLAGYYAVSRAAEIFIAFIQDSKDKMENKPAEKEGLKYSERYSLALRSYMELTANYAIIYYALNTGYASYLLGENTLFEPGFESILEALYFSINNITLLGYGDIVPQHPLSQLSAMFQVITGVFLLIITFTIYVTLNFSNPDTLNSQDRLRETERGAMLTMIHILVILVVGAAFAIHISQWLAGGQ